MKRTFKLGLIALCLTSLFTRCSNNNSVSTDTRHQEIQTSANKRSEQRVAVLFRKTSVAVDSLTELESRLTKVLEESKTGIYRNNYEEIPGYLTLHMFGPNADTVFSRIKPVLKQYSFMKEAKIEFRLTPSATNGQYIKFDL